MIDITRSEEKWKPHSIRVSWNNTRHGCATLMPQHWLERYEQRSTPCSLSPTSVSSLGRYTAKPVQNRCAHHGFFDTSSCPCDKSQWLCRSLGLQSTELPSSLSSYPSSIPSFFLLCHSSILFYLYRFLVALKGIWGWLRVLICSITGVQAILLFCFFPCFVFSPHIFSVALSADNPLLIIALPPLSFHALFASGSKNFSWPLPTSSAPGYPWTLYTLIVFPHLWLRTLWSIKASPKAPLVFCSTRTEHTPF